MFPFYVYIHPDSNIKGLNLSYLQTLENSILMRKCK